MEVKYETSFENIANKGQPNGYAPLDADGYVVEEFFDPALLAGGVNWGDVINGITGVGVTATLSNNAQAGAIGQKIVMSDTQTNALVGLQLETGVSALMHTGLNILARNAYGIKINEYASATQSLVNNTRSILLGLNFNTSSAYDHRHIFITNENNGSTGNNVGLYIDSKGTTLNRSAISILQNGVAGTAFYVTTASNVNSSTNGLVNYTLSNTQSGASVIQKISTGTSAQGHTAYQAMVYNANTSTKAFDVLMSTAGSGIGYNYTSSSLGGLGQFANWAHTASGTLTACTVSKFNLTTSRTYTLTSGSVTDNFNNAYFKRTSITTGAGGALTVTGSILHLENIVTQTAGTLIDTSALLKLTQSNNSLGGHILFNSYSGAPTIDGTFWFNGTDLKIRAGGVTYTLSKT